MLTSHFWVVVEQLRGKLDLGSFSADEKFAFDMHCVILILVLGYTVW